MKAEILALLVKENSQSHISACTVSSIYPCLKNRAGGKKALIKNLNQLIKQGKVIKKSTLNGITHFIARNES